MNECNPDFDAFEELPVSIAPPPDIALEQLPVALALFDLDLRCLRASERWLEEFGLQRAQAIGRSYRETFQVPFPNLAALKEQCARHQRYRSPRESLELPDGTRVWVRWEIHPWPHPQGELHGFIFQAEIARKTLFEEIFALSPAMMCLVGLDGNFQAVNPPWTEVLGFSAAELMGRSYLELVHPEDREAALEIAKNAIAGNKSPELENRYRCQDGSYKWLSWTTIPLLERQQIYGIARDITARKQAEEALKVQQEILQATIDTTPHWLCIKDWNGRYVMANRAIARAFDTTPENLIGQSMTDVHAHPEEVDLLLRQDREVMTTLKEQFIAEEMVKTTAGKRIWLQTIKRPLFLPNTSVPHVLVSASDISRRKHVEEELQKLAALVANSTDAIAIASLEGEPLFLNPAALLLIGFETIEAAQNQHLIDFFPAENRPFLQEQILPVVLEEGYWQGEFYFQNIPTGKTIPIDFNLFVIKDSKSAEPLALATIARNISDRKQAEKEQEKLLSIVESTTDLIGIADERGFFTYLNQSGRKMLALEPDADISSLSLFEVLHPAELQIPSERWFVQLIGNGIWEGEGLLHCRDGRKIPISQVAIASKSPDGNVEFLANIARDISDRKHLESFLTQQAASLEQTLKKLRRTQMQLVQTEKMSGLGQLVAGVAHEINNPVNFIYGNLSHADSYIQDLLSLIALYQEELIQPSAKIQEKIEQIDLEFILDDLPDVLSSMKIGAERIRTIVTSLRNFSRTDESEKKIVDLHEGLESTLLLLQNRLKSMGTRPEIEVIRDYGTLPPVECYAGHLNQVFMNILTNAIDAIEERNEQLSLEGSQKERGKIRICTHQLNEETVEIRIADNGSGIPKAIQSRLFDPFFTTKNVGKGTGLGLAVSYQIVAEQHRGQLQFICNPQTGTEFTIVIPARQTG